jgi:hypothetical protein
MLHSEAAVLVGVLNSIIVIIIIIIIIIIIMITFVIVAGVGIPLSVSGARTLGNFRVPSFVHDQVRLMSAAES